MNLTKIFLAILTIRHCLRKKQTNSLQNAYFADFVTSTTLQLSYHLIQNPKLQQTLFMVFLELEIQNLQQNQQSIIQEKAIAKPPFASVHNWGSRGVACCFDMPQTAEASRNNCFFPVRVQICMRNHSHFVLLRLIYKDNQPCQVLLKIAWIYSVKLGCLECVWSMDYGFL